MRCPLLDGSHVAPRVVDFPERREHLHKIRVYPPITRVELEHALELSARFLLLAGIEQAEPEGSAQLADLRVLLYRRMQHAEGFVPTGGENEHPCEIVRRVFRQRIEQSRTLHRSDGLLEFSLCRQNPAEAVM